ncbi:unnamed protein product [Eruca vesicaria subsp. sativa]|uniref:Uncharacterized protein n=1 Tax=Eruca vesicaria subsp. sativa TaxID=29727 RepID=A0ABC8LGJ1_ERUVS|nr:unnamed protein product [Eruca vesicaria subsp. sativa]
MSRVVHVFKGQWSKTQQGVWVCEQDNTLPTHNILVGTADQTPLLLTFQLPQWMLKPNGETWPPHNILTNADLDMMMTMHEGDVAPHICVIFGAEDVATFHFRCRAPFTIGTLNFLGEGGTEEEHMALVLDIIRGNKILYSDRLLNQMFDEDEMLLVYRFSLEMEKAKNSLDLNIGPQVEADDHIFPNIGNDYVETHVQDGFEAFNLGRDMTQSFPHCAYCPYFYTPPWHTIHIRPWYWENLMSLTYAMELQRIYGVHGSGYVGYVTNDLNIGNLNTHHMHGYTTNEPTSGYGNLIDVSSTASSTEVKTVVEMVNDISSSKKTIGFGGQVCQEKGESSSVPVGKTLPDLDVKLEMGNLQNTKDNDGITGLDGDA